MSGKNRAFALAVATAALVGMSAPVAGAATIQGSPSGFNNDSVLNLSGNQIPTQTCTSGDPVNTVTSVQTLTSGLASILPIMSTGAVSPMQGNTCTQSPTQTNTTTANTATTTAASEDTDSYSSMSWSEGSDPSSAPSPSTSGFNNDSVVNASGNQLPVQTCTSGDPVNTVTATQTLVGLLSFLPIMSTGAVSPMQGNTCTQTPAQTNTTTANTGS